MTYRQPVRVPVKYDRPTTGGPPWLTYCTSLPILIWIMLWFGINTGPWVLRHQPQDLLGFLHYFRTILPFVMFVIGSSAILYQNTRERVIVGPVRLWVAYAILGLLSGWISSPRPFDSTYWIIVYLTAFVCLKLFLQGTQILQKAVYLNYFSWIITAAFLAILLFAARDVLFVDTRWGLSGYGLIHRMDTVAGTAMSRSSGMARFASVPAVVAFVFLWGGSGFKRLLWIVPFILSATLVYLMQSRGALLGLGFALGFVMVFLGKRTRFVGAVLLVLFGSMLHTEMIPEERIELEKDRFRRGAKSDEEFIPMTGRRLAWERAWDKIQESPVLGYGPQSDRRLVGAHVHNTYLYALLQAGFIGGAAFVGGLVWAWLLFFLAIWRHTADHFGQRVFLIQTGGILAFFTVRSIPEVCGAMFGVDFMVMLPILAYLVILNQRSVAFPVRTYKPMPKLPPPNLSRGEGQSPFPKRPQCPPRPSKSPWW